MSKTLFKFLFKNNLFLNITAFLIFLYLKLVYLTSRWYFIRSAGIAKEDLDNGGTLFAIWHNRLAFGMYIYKKICQNYKNIYAIASSHRDGRIITKVIKLMDYKIIQGSSNKNASLVVRQIIRHLADNGKIVITPDGPRGPVYKINSNITRIAYKYQKKIIPVSCFANKYIELNSWDMMIIPKPFSRIIVAIGSPLSLTGNKDNDDKILLRELLNLSELTNSICLNK